MNDAPHMLEALEDRRLLAAQPYDWDSVTIKANGFIDGIVYHPAQQDLVYMHTDMGGAYRWDQGAARWTPLNDWARWDDWPTKHMGVETLAVDPTDANRVYMAVGTYMSPTAIMRSTDQGRTWLRTDAPFESNGNGPGRNAGERMLVDPNAPNILFYGTREDGLWKSTNYGATWSQVVSFPATGDSSGVTNDVGIVWLQMDKTSAAPGSATQTLYAGVSTVGSNKVFRSLDGGATWTTFATTPAPLVAANIFPIRSALTGDGNHLYLTYSIGDVGPNGATGGYVYKMANPDSATPTWTNVTPPTGQGGWSGIDVDPNNPNTVFVSTLDRWWPADEIYRSTNGGANWTALSPNDHRDDSSAAYATSLGMHWLGDVQIDPFNSNRVMVTTGYGLYRSTNASAATNVNWSFFNEGFEQSAVLELASPNGGTVNLFSAIGDRDGYRHDNFAASPSIGRHGQSNGLASGTSDDIDVSWDNANFLVRTVRVAPWVQYSTNNGVTWSWFSATNTSGNGNGPNVAAISADGTKAIYEPGGGGRVRYATRSGATWGAWTNPATNQPADGAKIVAEQVAGSQTFYAYAGTTVSRSTDGGANWTIMGSAAPGGGGWIRAVQGQAGHLVMSVGGNGLWRTTNGGTTWSRVNSGAVTTANQVGVGAGPTPGSYPSFYVNGTVSGQVGFFRSDDQGATWTMISDLSHQYGQVTVIQGDPRVYGRLYVGSNGRGVLYGDIHQAPVGLPAGWSTQDVGSVGSIGNAAQSAPGAWEVIGGGVGIGGTSDGFRFAYTQLTGDGTITARVIDVPSASPANNNAKAGVMFRNALTANSAQAFVGLTPGSASGVLFQRRSTAGAATSSTGETIGVWPPYWVRLVRAGNTFTAFRSADGVSWTQLGATQTIAMGSAVYVGLAVTASDNNQLNVSHFENVSVVAAAPPIAAIAPVATPRADAVASFTITFDQPVSGFDLSDLALTRDGTAVSLAGATLMSADGGTTWTLSGTGPLTDEVGNYTLTIVAGGSEIRGSVSTAMVANESESWALNTLLGTGAANAIRLVRNGAVTDYFLADNYQYSFNAAALGQLIVNGLGGDDTLTIDLGGGNPVSGGMLFDGGADADTVAVLGSAAADAVTFDATHVNVGSAVALIAVELRTFDGNGGSDVVVLQAGDLRFPRVQRLSSLTINDGTATLVADSGLLRTAALSIGASGRLDLNNNDLIVDYTGDSVETAIRDLVKRGINTGYGITSTIGALAGNTVLAIAGNADLNRTSWGTEPIDPTTIIGKYTYYGDANLDGRVTSDDYVAVDVGLGIGTKWLQGDFNLDGFVTSDDYVSIDVNLGAGPPLIAATPAPEPASVTAAAAEAERFDEFIARRRRKGRLR